jgi:hypothetical protein
MYRSGKVITVSKEEEEEKKLTKGLAFVRRETTTTIKKEMKRRGSRERVRMSSSISFSNFPMSLFVPFTLND